MYSNCGGYGDGAGTRTSLKANEQTRDVNGDGCLDWAGTGMGVVTRGRTLDGNCGESRDTNERSLGDEDGDEDVNRDENEDGFVESGGEATKRKKLLHTVSHCPSLSRGAA